ncbi:hypothetical protein [Dickeya phage Sucellus]|nr:hypothetical protein [Dickeya phage Sucellus]
MKKINLMKEIRKHTIKNGNGTWSVIVYGKCICVIKKDSLTTVMTKPIKRFVSFSVSLSDGTVRMGFKNIFAALNHVIPLFVNSLTSERYDTNKAPAEVALNKAKEELTIVKNKLNYVGDEDQYVIVSNNSRDVELMDKNVNSRTHHIADKIGAFIWHSNEFNGAKLPPSRQCITLRFAIEIQIEYIKRSIEYISALIKRIDYANKASQRQFD